VLIANVSIYRNGTRPFFFCCDSPTAACLFLTCNAIVLQFVL
jgi:hypothetical protein